MNFKEKITNYIKNIAKEVYDELKPNEEYFGGYALPEIKRNELLACSIQKTHADFISDMPQGVAMDSCMSLDKLQDSYSISNPVNDIIYTHFATQGFIGFQACAILTQNWLINKACTLPAKDAIRPDYELSYVTTDENEVIDKDFLTKITDESNDTKGFNVKKTCQTFAEKKRQFGQILAYPVVEGADYSIPFNIDSIKPNSYKGMKVIDPVWYQAILDSDAISNPQSLRYMKPTYFCLPDGSKIHHSWCLFHKNGEVPDILKPTYRWGGYPIPQLIYTRAYAAEKTANEAPMLAQSKRMLVVDINPKSYLLNSTETQKQLQVISEFRDNWGVMTKRPGDNVQQIDTSLTDLDEVIMTQFQLTAAAAGITATKLLETQPKGFNSTGDYEDDQYKLTLVSIQEEDYVPLLDFHYRLLSVSKYGISRDYTINFEEIDTPTEKERAEINSIKAQTASSYVQAGVISPDEVRDNLIKDPDSGFNDIIAEAPEDDFSFEDEPNNQGGSSNEQSPFSLDYDTEWRRTENGVPFPLTEGKTIKESCSKHFEKLQKEEKQKNKNNEIIVKGNELGENLSGEALRNKAKEYYKTHLANKTVENEKLGTVKFSNGGFSKPISASKDEKKLKLLPFLPDIIRTGDVSEPIADRYNRPNVKAFYTITKTIKFEGKSKKVRVTIREDNNGKLYYDHTFAIPEKGAQDSIDFE